MKKPAQVATADGKAVPEAAMGPRLEKRAEEINRDPSAFLAGAPAAGAMPKI